MQEIVSETVCRIKNVSNLVPEHCTMFWRYALDSIEDPQTQEADWDQTAQVYGKAAKFDGFSK